MSTPHGPEWLEPSRQDKIRFAIVRWFLIGIAALTHEYLVRNGLDRSSLMFIGIPTLLGAGFALLGPRRHPVLSTARGLLLAFLVAFTLLKEGVVCVMMAAPLFLVVAALVHLLRRAAEKADVNSTARSFAIVIPLALMSLEGTHAALSFNRLGVESVERVIAAAPEAVARRLAEPLAFKDPMPTFFRLGFPQPERMAGSGLAVGDRRAVLFGGQGSGVLVLEVADSDPGHVRFRVVEDRSMIAHWLGWRGADVSWHPDGSGTRVRWTLEYERRLDPAWYFAPLERYAVGLAARVLIDSVAD